MPEDTTTRFVGLDVHKRQITACFVDAEGKKLTTRSFVLTRARLAHFAQHVLRPTDQVALEATTNCWAVAGVLEPHVARVVVSNPLVTKAIAQSKVKTDKVDAHVLAQLLRCDFLPAVWHPDETTQRMRELTGRRAALVQQRTALRNRIHSVLAVRLIETPETGQVAWWQPHRENAGSGLCRRRSAQATSDDRRRATGHRASGLHVVRRRSGSRAPQTAQEAIRLTNRTTSLNRSIAI